MSFSNLPTLAEIQATRRAPQKAGLPTPLAKKAKAKSREEKAEAFRRAVWERDKGRSRATGKPLVKSGTMDWARLGEVDHAYPRSTSPDRIYDVSNGILLSKEENRLRKVACLHAPEFRMFSYDGPDDRGKEQRFIWRNEDGKIIKERRG